MKRSTAKAALPPKGRTLILNVRLSAEEVVHCRISAKAAGQKVSEWVRGQILPPNLSNLKRDRPRARPLVGEPVLRELIHIRNLLFQIAAGGYRDSDQACAPLQEQLATIEAELERIGWETQTCTSNS